MTVSFYFLAQAAEGGISATTQSVFAFLAGCTIAFVIWISGRRNAAILQDRVNRVKQEAAASKEAILADCKTKNDEYYKNEKLKFAQILGDCEQEFTDAQSQLVLKDEHHQRVLLERDALQGAIRDLERVKSTNPTYKKQIYHIGIIGITGSGKTALVLRLIDPLLSNIEGFAATPVNARYDKSIHVTFNQAEATRNEHIFRFHEWGGEYLVEAQRDILKMCHRGAAMDKDGTVDLPGLHALIFAVDLGDWKREPIDKPTESQSYSAARIRQQVEEYFSSQKLPFLLNDTVMTQCRIVILFINKIDLWRLAALPESPEQIYQKLILALRQICGQTPVEVIIGSAQTEEGLLSLSAHLVRRILPDNARGGNVGVADQFKAKSVRSVPVASPPPSSEKDGDGVKSGSEAAVDTE